MNKEWEKIRVASKVIFDRQGVETYAGQLAYIVGAIAKTCQEDGAKHTLDTMESIFRKMKQDANA